MTFCISPTTKGYIHVCECVYVWRWVECQGWGRLPFWINPSVAPVVGKIQPLRKVVSVIQSCPTLQPLGLSLPGSSVHGIS